MNAIKILTAGTLATVQDTGRIGHQGEGLPNSGVMDNFAYQIGNALVGNCPSDNSASIEFAITGGKIQISSQTIVALTGARALVKRNDEVVSQDMPILVKENDVLDFTQITQGRFIYLSVAGGVQVPTRMGSRSTSLSIKLGGFNGRSLEHGDVLPILSLAEAWPRLQPKLSPKMPNQLVSLTTRHKVRIVDGPESDWFSNKDWEKLLSQAFHLGKHIDRMGYRLDGPEINAKTENLLSEANMNGAIQISRDGQPIILLADRATHGGYPVIAKVMTADLGILAQWPQDQPIFFEKVAISDAWEMTAEMDRFIKGVYQSHPWETLLPIRIMANKIKQLF